MFTVIAYLETSHYVDSNGKLVLGLSFEQKAVESFKPEAERRFHFVMQTDIHQRFTAKTRREALQAYEQWYRTANVDTNALVMKDGKKNSLK